MTTPPAPPEIGPQLIALFAAGMLVVQLLLVVQRMLLTNIRLFALQSLLLAGIAAIIAFFHNAAHVYVVAVLTVVGKVLFLPWLLDRQVRLSRDLVNEIPVLRAELDPRADAALLELISELETVLLQTANLESGYGIVDIQLIQQGAQRKALLFKIDMGESILSRDAGVQKEKSSQDKISGRKKGGSLS